MRDVRRSMGVAIFAVATCLAVASCSTSEGISGDSGGVRVAWNAVQGQVGVQAVPVGAGDPTTEAPSTTVQPVTRITIAAVGDVMVHTPLLRTAKAEGAPGYDFRPIFAPVEPYLSIADYAVCNLETRLAGSQFGYRSYPRFNSPAELADALVDAGFDLAATANNHSLDKGWAGIVNTLDNLDAAGLAHVGTHRSLEEKATPFIVDIKGIKVAFLNYTDYLNEFTPPRDHKEYAVNILDYRDSAVAEEAEAARAAGADLVIAILHWGREYCPKPWFYQVELAEGSEDKKGLLAREVDVILGGHPHVVEPIVHVPLYTDGQKRDTYVVYSMGNFVSGMRGKHTSIGVIVYVDIEKKGEETKVTGIRYLPVIVQQSGAYPRKVRVLPAMPGLEPDTDTPISDADQKRMDEAWDYVYQVLCRPEDNIVPLDLPE